MTTRLHIVHVANMKNKGTQALLKCDVIAIREIIQDTYLSVSTTDLEGVRHLNLPLDSILPPIVDIPYERSDQLARVRGWSRSSVQYKASVLAFSVFMVIQLLLSAISVMFMKIGMLAIYRRKVMEHFKDCHLVVSHSNENFKETASLLPLTPTWAITRWSMLLVRTWTVFVAKSFRKPIIMFPNSVGPFRTRVAQRLAAFALNNCNSLLIRDEVSYEITKNLVKPNFKERVILTYDTALLFQPRTQVKHKHTAGPLVAVCPGIYGHRLPPVKIQEYVSAHAEALDEAVATYGFHLLFLPHYVSGFEHDDLNMCRLIISQMKQKNNVECISTRTVDEFKSYLNETDMIIASKMHPAVLGVSGYVPVLCIAYDHKQTSFFKRLGMDFCTLEIQKVSFQTLSLMIKSIWTQRDQLKETLKTKIPAWQDDVKRALRRVLAPYAVKMRDESC